MKQIIIDTDGNTEALETIRYALSQKDVCLRAITTVASGLTALEATSNVLSALDEIGDESTQVYKGLEEPIRKIEKPLKLRTHELLDGDFKYPKTKESAVNKIIQLVNEGDVEIITMGPLSNIAMAFAKDRKAMSKVKRITMLAGMVFHGDVGPLAEYNCYMDAYGMDFILKTGVDITIVPIEVGTYRERMEYALNPDLAQKRYDSYTRIELIGEFTYGASINDVRDRNRKEFVAQSNVLHPFNCSLVLDNCEEEITMEA